MVNTVQVELRKIEKAAAKLRNSTLKRADLDYTVQVSISSTDPKTVVYAMQMTAPAAGLAPITFIAPTADEIIQRIKIAQKKFDKDFVEIAYHDAQIEACKRTIKGHEERIEEIKNPPQEEDTEEAVAPESKEEEAKDE